MDKTEKLLRMADHPEQYSDKDWQELLADAECREFYETMQLCTDAFEAEDGKARLADGLKEQEWKKIEARHFASRRHVWGWMQMAAAIVGVLMLSGIAYAAVKMFTSASIPKQAEHLAASSMGKPSSPLEKQSEAMTDSIAPRRIFENVPLDEMVNEIAAYYNKVAVIQNARAHELRLYYKWERKDGLEDVVNDLNHFDHVDLAIEGDKLILKP
jgi:ferric-dicitrate binding protein FerR (iron transport regulator)